MCTYTFRQAGTYRRLPSPSGKREASESLSRENKRKEKSHSQVATGTKLVPNGSKVLTFYGLRRVLGTKLLNSRDDPTEEFFLLAAQIDSNQCAPGNTTRTAQTRLSVRYFCGRSKIRISISGSSSRKGPHQASSTRSRQVGRLRVIRSQVNLTLVQIFSSSCSNSRALFRLRITAHQVSNTRALLRARARALLFAG